MNAWRGVAYTLGAVLLVGCQSSPGQTTGSGSGSQASAAASAAKVSGEGVPLTLEQAEVLSSVLVKNFEVGGAEFKVTVPFGSAATFHLDGTVDYKRHFAGATLRVEGSQPAPPPAAVFWNLTDVVEGIDGLGAELAALGRPPAKYLARPLTKTSTQDVVLNLVLATSAEQRDNPQLVQQGTARFLRTDAIGGAPVDVYRYGPRTTYWVRKSDALLMRVEADLAVATGTTVIDLVDHRAIELTGPLRDEVVSAKDLPDEVIVRLTGVNATVKGS